MSMRPRSWPEPDPVIAAAIRSMYRVKRQPPLPVRVRDELGELFADEEFAAACGIEGKPGWSPGRLALITVLQRVDNLTDRQAADTVRTDLSWKYALGLALDDPGFDASVLSEFRTRVIAHGLEEKALDLAPAENSIRAAQAACEYSWRTPPSRSRRRIFRSSVRFGSVIGSGTVRSGAA
ncbi:transposase [Thermoactinospora rubra]|uniref:transposase n=1 Tax=Thermoactinospora rubra TaxID=1088767 RepID=UPI003B84B2C4